MLPARSVGAKARFFTTANFTLREGQHKVNEGSYPLACRQRRPRSTAGTALKLLATHRPQTAGAARF